MDPQVKAIANRWWSDGDFREANPSLPETLDFPREQPDKSATGARVRTPASVISIARAWEESINQELLMIMGRGVAIKQCGPPTQRIYTDNQHHLITLETQPGPPDYMGVWSNGAIMFDAKITTKGTSFAFKRPSANSKGNWHQFEFMRTAKEVCSTTIAGVYVHWVEHRESRWHPIEVFSENGSHPRIAGHLVNSIYDILALQEIYQ